jgi:hypothetical protein
VGLFTVLAVACGGSSSDDAGASGGKGGKGGSGAGVAGKGPTGATGGAGASTGGTGGTTGGAAGTGGSRAGRGGSDSAGTGGASARAGVSGSEEGGAAGSNDGGGGVAIDDAPAEVAVDLCDRIYECCSAEELMNLQGVGTSKGQCEFSVALFVQLQVAQVKPAIAAGRVVYDGTALERCLTDYGARSCDMLRGIETFECEGLIVPQQSPGDPCGVSPECSDGYCVGGGDAQNPEGECAPTKARGIACAADVECQSGFCDTSGACAEPSSSALCGG